ncbi:MAG: copper-binding protein [Ignavibacteriota bacterium]
MKTFYSFPTLIVALIAFVPTGCNSSPKSDEIKSNTIHLSDHTQGDSTRSPAEQAVKTYRVLAKVTAISEADSTIAIDHERIEGYMAPMEMPYKVSDHSILKQVCVGTEGHFTIRVKDGQGTITHVHVHSK